MALELRGYQERSLAILEQFLHRASSIGAAKAFTEVTKRSYRGIDRLPDLPYVCLRMPTGGGKTLTACHALGIATREFLRAERSVCLWLVPTNTIRDQTLRALRDRQHPYREALSDRFGGAIRVMDLGEALTIQRGTLDGETCIIVSTLAALRVEDTEGRKVYETNGTLQHHFDGLGPREEWLERREDGSIPYSLANVLRLRRPLVIVDEAHNARTPLSFETLARFWPSCIIEFTATPETTHKPSGGLYASNVLHHVSALELKADHMVKLPIKLRTRADWKEIIADGVETQKKLERLAIEEEKETGEYIRPIMLLQAQSRSQTRDTLNVDVVKRTLLEDFNIPEDHIAVATGETRELDAVDLFERNCPVRYIITVQALKEGWDCSFAYILCSVAEIGSSRAVEQILGRILRLPRAEPKMRAELNCAYALAASPRFIEAAEALADALIENGFQKLEARQLIVEDDEPEPTLFGPGMLWADTAPVTRELVPENPDLTCLPESLRGRVSFDQGSNTLSVAGTISESDSAAIQRCFALPAAKEVVQRMYETSQRRAAREASPSLLGKPFRVPQLSIRIDGQLELFEESHVLAEPWDLSVSDATLTEGEFPSQIAGGTALEVDVDDTGKAAWQFVSQLHEQLDTLILDTGWTQAALVTWLAQQIPVPLRHEFRHEELSIYIDRVLAGLLGSRKVSVEQLARQKYRLRRAVVSKIEELRREHMSRTFQRMLFDPGTADIQVDPGLCFRFSGENYAPNQYDTRGCRWRKHYFRLVGAFDTDEEYECAVFIDSMPQTRYWVRNLAQRPDSSFWLQTSSDRFYPDFVVLLEDERILVVESKGEHLWSTDDSKEKRNVGALWQERSKGRCLFVMPKGTDWAAIQAVVDGTLV